MIITITNQGNSFKVEGQIPNSYFSGGTLTAPKNSMIAVVEGDIISFKTASDFETLFATTLRELIINGVQADSENIDTLLNTTIYKINGGGGGTGGTEYFAGQNIDISEENVISVTGLSIPNKTSDLTNDSGFITSADVHTYSAGTNIDITNDVISVTGLSIPTKVSDLQNDEGYITSADIPTIPSKTSDLTNDSGYITSADVPQYSGSTNINVVDNVISLTGVPTEFKTINGQSITGSGNITIEGGTGGTVYTAGQNIDITNNVISVTGITEPTKTSDLENDSGYITMSDIPSIPTKTSDLENDNGFITSDALTAYTRTQNFATVNGQSITNGGDVLIPTGPTYTAGDNISLVNNEISVVGIPTEFKTINNQSITGSGNITIEGGTEYTAGTNIDITNNVISVTGINVPTSASQLTNDTNYITMVVLTQAEYNQLSIAEKNDPTKLYSISDAPLIGHEYSAGTNISIVDDVISVSGIPTEFKTINNQSITGNGNITIESTSYSGGQNISIVDNVISVTGLSIPTKTSDLTNDSGYITSSDIPSIPSKTSDLTNDSGYITSADVHTYSGGTNISIVDDVISVTGLSIPTKTSDLQNDSGFITSSDVPEYSGSTNINVVDNVISLTGVPTEFKTINNQPITGSGNITVETTAYSGGTNIDITDHVISVTGINVPTSASQLTNDAGYVSTVLLTQAQYDVLSTAEKNDPTKLYIITDAASPAFIDDTLVSSGSTYSSQKIETILGDIETALSNI